MMAMQFNLLPDVKLRYIQAQKTRNLVTSIALLACGVAVALFLILLFSTDVIQKKQLSDADKDITCLTKQVQNTPGFARVLTVRNQLNTLPTLHGSKHISSRIFGYLPQVTPTNVKVTSLTLDFTTNNMLVNGTADSHHTINAFIDTLKFTTYKLNDQDSNHAAFPSVVESGFNVAPNNVNYALSVQFDPQLFSNQSGQAPKLNVPNLVSTRSVVADPANVLFSGGQ